MAKWALSGWIFTSLKLHLVDIIRLNVNVTEAPCSGHITVGL